MEKIKENDADFSIELKKQMISAPNGALKTKSVIDWF
jgi:hypothetical protein